MKKIISVLLAVIFLLQASAVFADPWDYDFEGMLYENGYDESQGRIYYTVGTNTITKKVKFSMDMGLIEAYSPDSTVTRGDLKAALNLVFGSDHFYYEYFKEDTDENVLGVDETIVVLMDATGYGKLIAVNGTTNKAAYYGEAQKRGLLTGVKYKEASKKFTMEQFYTMFYNALNLDMVEAFYSTNSTEYRLTGRTIMGTYFGLSLVEGVVKANEFTSINGGKEAGEGALKIHNTLFPYVDTIVDANDYIGHNVDAYVNRDGVIVSIAVDETENTMKIFSDPEDIVLSDSKYEFKYYDENDRIKTLNISAQADVVYNHSCYPEYTAADLKIDNGYIRFIDNNNDKKQDVVMIYNYTSFIPRQKSASKKIVVDALGNEYDIEDVSEGRYYGMKNLDGKKLEFNDVIITQGVSLLVKPNSNVVTELILLDDNMTYEGVYSKHLITQDAYVVGESTFKMSKIYARENAGKFPHKIGERVLLILDQFGKIVKSVNVEDEIKYGFVLGIRGDDDVFSTGLKVKIFTEDQQMLVLPFAKKFTFSNGSYVQIAEGESILHSAKITPETFLTTNIGEKIYSFTAKTTTPQLVRFKLNGKDEVCELLLADETNKENGSVNETDGFQMNYESASAMYHSAGAVNCFAGKYFINGGKTKMFVLPDDLSREDLFRISVKNAIYSDNGYNVKIYDVDDTYTPGAIVVRVQAVPTWMGTSDARFVVYQGTTIDKMTGEPEPYVAYTVDAGEMTEYFGPYNRRYEYFNPYKDEDGNVDNTKTATGISGAYANNIRVVEDLRTGDLFEACRDYNGKVTTWKVMLALDYDVPFEEQCFEAVNELGSGNSGVTEDRFFAKDLYTFCRVMKVYEEGFVFNGHYDAEKGFEKKWNRNIFMPKNKPCRLFEYESGKYSMISVADIQEGDFVYLRAIVVYRP